jgi:hypothetical protein
MKTKLVKSLMGVSAPSSKWQSMVLRLIVTAGLMVLTLNGCTTPGFRLNGNFNSQPLGKPQQFPIPSPPNDQFTWLVHEPLASVIVANPAGGKWVLTTPTRDFVLVDPDRMHEYLLATSEPFNFAGSPIRGTFSIRLVGTGRVSFGVRAVRGNVRSFICAGELFVGPFTPGGDVGVVVGDPSIVDNFDRWKYEGFPVTAIGSYKPAEEDKPGETAQFFYTIDQSRQTVHLTVGGAGQGTSENNYSFSGPIQQLSLCLFLRQPGLRTVVLTNDVTMEEL